MPTVPQPAVPTGHVKIMAVPPTPQPTAIPEPKFSILPFPFPIGTDKVGTMPVFPTDAPKVDDRAKYDGDLLAAANVACEGGEKKSHAKGKHAHHDDKKKNNNKKVKSHKTTHADEAKEEEPAQERQAGTAWETVLKEVKNIGSTASDYFSHLKSFVIGGSKVEVEENDDNASPKAARENEDL
ncbi:hypothetical protein BG003_004867 [Podila horticola]|nr:hypothetical protein BG003_004867 [Podila horticola]